MRQLPFVILLLLILLPEARGAHAARLGPLLLGTPEQQVGLTYLFDGQQQTNTLQRHDFTEEYGFGMKYAVGTPNLWRGNFLAKLRLDQELASSSAGTGGNDTSHIGFLYDINGILLGKSVTPGAFSAKSDITQVSTPFAKTYQITNTVYDLRWSLENKLVPISLEYVTGTSKTDGLPVDSTRDRNEFYLHARHTKSISTTSLDLVHTRSVYTPTEGTGNFDTRYEARFQNSLFWADKDRAREVTTRWQYVETAGINFSKYFNLNESLLWELGKSLRTGGDYSLSTTSGDPGTQVHNTGSVWLQHQLLKSLTTRLNLRVRDDVLPIGVDREVSGGGSLSYVKQLPAQGVLALGTNAQYSVDDRKLGTGQEHILNEQHPVSFGTHLVLAQPNVIASSITVRNADPFKRLAPYDLNVDYTVVTTGVLTEIVPAGAINDGDLLLISYDFLVDPSLKTKNTSYGVNGSLVLFGGSYRVYGNYTHSNQDRLAGQATLSTLTTQATSQLGLERKWETVTLGAEYNYVDSEADRHQSVLTQARYAKVLREKNLTFVCSDQFNWYEPVSIGGTSSHRANENFLTASAAISTRLSASTYLSLSSNYINVVGASSSDSLTVGSSINWSLGKMLITLDTTFGMRRQEDFTAFNENVRLHALRYF